MNPLALLMLAAVPPQIDPEAVVRVAVAVATAAAPPSPTPEWDAVRARAERGERVFVASDVSAESGWEPVRVPGWPAGRYEVFLGPPGVQMVRHPDPVGEVCRT